MESSTWIKKWIQLTRFGTAGLYFYAHDCNFELWDSIKNYIATGLLRLLLVKKKHLSFSSVEYLV